MSDSTVTCGTCGRAIPDDAPGLVCPPCLATALLTEGGVRLDPPASPPLSTLHSLEDFRILRTLGEGGFGTVYAADQLRPVRRPVAIKVLKPGAGGTRALARFEAERQALARIEHPNVARVYDAGETDDGQPYFVMELIEGVPITEHARERNLPLPERLALFQEVCSAIGHAHRRGIIHRDIKPSNILVAEEDGRAVPKVIDFGIAKATEEVLTEQTLVTRNHELLGTPAYMSPEQAAGGSMAVDIRADLYSLGTLLYELIAGEPPFSATQLRELPYDEALRTIRTVDPALPSQRLRQAGGERPAAASDLDAIVTKAIEKDPEHRYESAEAFQRDLAAYLSGEAVSARRAGPLYRWGKFVRKNRGLVTAAALVLLSLIAGTIVSTMLFVQARDSARKAAESETRGKQRFSHADFTQATPYLNSEQPAIAVAHLARAVRTDPSNRAAAIRLLETLATRNWAVPATRPLPVGGKVLGVRYSADGNRLYTLSDEQQLGVWDPLHGERLQTIELAALPSALTVSPDDKFLAVMLPQAGQILIWHGEDYSPVATIKTPAGRGGSLSFSPDSRFLLSSHDNGHTHLWDLESQSLHKCIPQEGDYVRAYFSPDGSRIATYNSKHVRLWSLDGDPLLDDPLPASGGFLAPIFLPDSSRLLTWSADGAAQLWDVSTGKAVRAPLQHPAPIRIASLHPDGRRLVTACKDGFLRLWNVESGRLLAPPRAAGNVLTLAFSPDGSRIASGSGSRGESEAVRIWDARTFEPQCAPIHHPRGASGIAFHPDGNHLAIRSRHDELTTWDIRARSAEPLSLPHEGKPVWRTRFDREDRELVTLALDGEARAWDAETGQLLHDQPVTSGPVAIRAHAASEGHRGLRSGFRQGRFYGQPHWSLPSFDRLVAAPFRDGGVQAAAASSDGRLLATGCSDGHVRLWSLMDGQSAGSALEHGAPVTAVAFDPETGRVASGAADGTLRLWRLSDRELLADLTPHTKAILALSFSPDGTVLAIGSADHTARLWFGSSLSTPLPHEGVVSQLSYSGNGEFLATGSRDNSVRIWRTSDGHAVAGPLRHIDSASLPGLFALWSPDGQSLVSTASHDDMARVWDPLTGRALAKPMMLPNCPLSAALDPSGQVLLVGGDFDFQTRIWDPASGEPLGPPHDNGGRVLACSFNSNGSRYAAGTRRGLVHLRDFPLCSRPLAPDEIAFLEALGGFRFDDSGILEPVPADRWLEDRDRILANSPGDSLGVWLRWLASDPSTRPGSPFRSAPQPAP